MMNNKLFRLCLISYLAYVNSFVNIFGNLHPELRNTLSALSVANPERVIYASYLIGYRKQKNIISNITKATSSFIQFNKNKNDTYIIDNTNKEASQITMGNIILDITDIKYIYITTEKDEIKIKLDKKERPSNTLLEPGSILGGIHNIDAIYSTINLLEKFIHLS